MLQKYYDALYRAVEGHLHNARAFCLVTRLCPVTQYGGVKLKNIAVIAFFFYFVEDLEAISNNIIA